MKRSNLSLLLSLILVFGSGVVAGALGHRYYSLNTARASNPRPRTPEEFRQAYLNEMKTRLKLSEAQTQKLDEILDETRNKFRDLREKQRPEMKAIQDDQRAQINAMLTPAQQTEYDRMVKEREERKKAQEKERGH